MPKYLTKAKLTVDGLKGTMKEGATSRRASIEKMYEALGGKLEALYYAFGDTDAYVIADVPDNVTQAALAMAVTAAGGVVAETVVLFTPEEVDEATGMTVSYRPPGG